jgi:hypothetical protein
MKKAKFEYLKEDGSKSDRIVVNPSFVKESYNSYKDFNKNDVKYLSGYEIDSKNLSAEQIETYENCIKEYYSDVFMTLNEFLESKGLNPKNVNLKSFKKEGIQNLNIIE